MTKLLRIQAVAVLIVFLLAALLVGPAAHAQEGSHDTGHAAPDATHEGAHEDAHESGHEAVDKPALLHWDLGSAFWSIVVFVILLAVLRFSAWKPILDGLHKREEFIRESLASAKREREEADKQLAEYEEKLRKSREEATAIVDEGRRDAEEVKKRIVADAKAEAHAAAGRAKKDIKLARDAAVKQLHDQTILLATNVAGKIVRKELAEGDHKELVDEALAEMRGLN